MGHTTYLDAIRSHFYTQWDANGDDTYVVYENLDYRPVLGTAYLLFAIRPSETTWVSSGWRDTIGAVVIGVFAPQDAGPESAEELAELVSAQFRGQTFSSGAGTFDEPTVDAIGPDGQGWYQLNIRVPWHFQEAVS